jgi:uncharacterized membrane protein
VITISVFIQKSDPAKAAVNAQLLADLQALQAEYPHQLVLVDIDADETLRETYGVSTPVVEIGPYKLRKAISQQDLRAAIGAAADRQAHLSGVGDSAYRQRLERGHRMSKADRFSLWFSKHYLLVLNCIVAVFVGLPFLAPVLMDAGAEGPARVIYMVYSPLCHQMAFRSWFLFGEQPAYPRALAGVAGWKTYGEETALPENDILAARAFIGNRTTGYKVAFCERDVAIYGAILVFGLLFGATGRRLKSLPWYWWAILGVLPILVDGASQLPSLITGLNLAWLPFRESTPALRTLTGFLFGFTTAWYGFPYIEESVRDTRRLLVQKDAVAAQTAVSKG